MRWWVWAILGVAGLGAAGFFYVQSRLNAPVVSEDAIAELRSEVAAQNETVF